MVIRASQVIPVYPLTEDVQPGDVFLVLTPIQAQHEEYRKRGFLALDQHMSRQRSLAYLSFYESRYGISDTKLPPGVWQFPDTSRCDLAGDGDEAGEANTESDSRMPHDWCLAPRAAFPSYNFEVQSGGGLALAMPIQGVPVGLNMVYGDAASGSITISDAHTYGVSFEELDEVVRAWAAKARVRANLSAFRDAAADRRCWLFFTCDQDLFLRVVNRVYVTGGVTVSLNSTASFEGQVEAGAEQNLTIPDVTAGGSGDGEDGEAPGASDGPTAALYAASLERLSGRINNALPGGEIQVAWATNRGVTMAETFDRPLVIGYLGFDYPIRRDGSLGIPIATLSQLEQRSSSVDLDRLGFTSKQLDYLEITTNLKEMEDGAADAVWDRAAMEVGPQFVEVYKAKLEEKPDSPRIAFSRARSDFMLQDPSYEAITYYAVKRAYEERKR